MRFGNQDILAKDKILQEAFFCALASYNGRYVVELLKRMVGIVKTLFVAVIKNLIGQSLNGVVNSSKSVVVVSTEIVLCFLFDDGVIGRDDFGGFISGIRISFFLEITHDSGRRLIKAFIGQNASLLFVAAVYYHFAK